MNKKKRKTPITVFDGCQLPCVPKFADASARLPSSSIIVTFKYLLAVPWNNYLKKWLKNIYYFPVRIRGASSRQTTAKSFIPESKFREGDNVQVRSKEEITSTLDPFNELKGCSFLPEMHQYCGSEQRVFKSMRHFMDERDYKLKKTHGLVLLENVFCNGTPVFGPCDRSCFLFWREEWLKKVE